ncbi:hypothetical protein D3C71_1390790 [compost metagenome]
MFNQLIKLEVDGRRWVVHPAVVAVAQRGYAFIIQIFAQEFQLSNIVPFRRILIHIIPSVSLNFGVDNTL